MKDLTWVKYKLDGILDILSYIVFVYNMHRLLEGTKGIYIIFCKQELFIFMDKCYTKKNEEKNSFKHTDLFILK